MTRFATDKIGLGYLPAYLRIAAELGPNAAVCEVGVYRGGSLEMWQALFPGGTVVGVDHDPGAVWPDGTVGVVAEQDDAALPELLRLYAPDGFGLIVDDASHIGALTAGTFRLLWPLVASGGFYVIEDWQAGRGKVGGFDDSMLGLARDLVTMVDAGAETVTYRFGQIIVRKHRA